MTLPRFLAVRRGLTALALGFALLAAARAADANPRSFDVPAGNAAAALKTFSQQSGVEVIFPTDAVAGVRTNAARGEMSARQALEAMVQGTGFVVVQDEKTGALGLRSADDAATAAGRPATRVVETAAGGKTVEMAEVYVLGSRIRQTEAAGPSPVSSFDNDYIK